MQLQYVTPSRPLARVSVKRDSILDRISDCLLQPSSVQQQLALSDLGGAWTYAQLTDVTADLESWLIYLGIRAGDRVMIVADNCRAFVAILFALSRIDACPVLVSACLSQQQMDQLLALHPTRRVFYLINASSDARLHATRHHATVIDAIDWGPIAISEINESASPEPIEGEISHRVAIQTYWFDNVGHLRSEKFIHKDLLLVAAACARLSSHNSADPVHYAAPPCDVLGFSGVLLPALLTSGTIHLSGQSQRTAALKGFN